MHEITSIKLKPVKGENGLYGYVDKDNKLVINYKYIVAFPFKNGFADVKLGKAWGKIDTKGELKIENKFQQIIGDFFYDEEYQAYFARVRYKYKYFYIDLSGNFVDPYTNDRLRKKYELELLKQRKKKLQNHVESYKKICDEVSKLETELGDIDEKNKSTV